MKKIITLLTLFLATGGSALADSLTLTTARATGSNFTLNLDAGLTATLKWGDGTTETLAFEGQPLTTTVKNETLTVTTDGNIHHLFINNNDIKSLNVSNLTKLETLDCNDNAIQTLTLTKLVNLTTLWCSRNALTSLNLSKQTHLRKLFASDNKLSSLTLASNEITDLWIDNNAIAGKLDLSQVEKLHSLAADDNALTKIDLNGASSSKSALKFFYVPGNALFYNSFPSVYDKTKETYTIANILVPQSPYFYTNGFELGTQYDLSDLIRYNGWGVAITPTTVLRDKTTGAELIKGDASNPADYTMSGSYKYTFNTEHRYATATVTSAMYPNVELTTKPFAILSDFTSILEIEDDENGTAQPAYDLNGRRVDLDRCKNNAASGIYIQNGKKIIIK